MLLILKFFLIFRILSANISIIFWRLSLNRHKGIVMEKKSKMFFILGCGSSINSLSNEEIDIINKSDSVGINLFIAHKQINPTYYSVEVSDSGDDGKVQNSRLFSRLLKTKVLKQGNFKFLTSPENWSTLQRMIPDIGNYGEVNFVKQVGIPGRSIKFFSKLHQFAVSRSIKRLLSPRMTFGKNASVVALVYFGILRGYKNIVLCGVDLTSEYFWEGESGTLKYPDCKYFVNMHKSHSTSHKTDLMPLPVSQILSAINNSKCGTKLWVAKPSSKLAGKLPVFSFDQQ